MAKYKLNFSKLNSNSDIDVIEFTSASRRASFIADRVVGVKPDRVFTLIVSYSKTNDSEIDVYIFDNYSCVQDVVKSKWIDFFLFEWESYEEAYKNALDLREPNPLCYT